MGPHTFNFKRYLRQAAAGRWPDHRYDANSLVKEVSTLLTDEDYRLWYGRHAVEVLHQNQGALSRLLQLLQPYLPQRSH
ncbi:3-deoxy-D-manno-octulosonic-acid transferase [Klebsiella pneumoniae]|uniref:3-deoxy-D-manno-octulosonic-acid transferase n=1 Tax=Klebsiella pneumoniae TaxID=573 RepID=A0A378B5N3_KLEPN|nr:3-deoxy-D-manno-octulosonic-acid transferase [Klebsiella pneumoniae]